MFFDLTIFFFLHDHNIVKNSENYHFGMAPELYKFFFGIAGPPKPGQVRKMMGSPRQLENAVPTSKNPHGVWV